MHDEHDDDLRITEFELADEQFVVVSFPTINPAVSDELTRAEREVCRLALRGLSNEEIGERRGTATRTVANQLASIFSKLGVSSRSELAMLASGRGNEA